MKKFKIMAIAICILLILLMALIYIAYLYKPKENKDYSSKYLETVDDRYVELKDFRAHYVVKGEGKPVVLIHGGGSWLYSYRNNIDELSRKYKVYAVDMPGHGYTTEKTKVKYDLDTYAEFIKEFLESQKIDKSNIVGHSWGGGWSVYFTEKYPEMVDKLVLLDSSGLNEPDKSEWKYFGYPVIGEIISKLISLSNTKSSMKKMFINQSMLTDEYIEEIYTPLSFRENRNAQVQAQRHLDWSITEDRLKDIDKQVLIIFGKKDCYFDNNYAKKMNSKIKNSNLCMIENTSHMPHEEQYNDVDNKIFDFFK